MTFKEFLEIEGFDIDDLMSTEIGEYKTGQTFHVQGHTSYESAGDIVAAVELVVTALRFPTIDDGHRNPNCPICKKRICQKAGG